MNDLCESRRPPVVRVITDHCSPLDAIVLFVDAIKTSTCPVGVEQRCQPKGFDVARAL